VAVAGTIEIKLTEWPEGLARLRSELARILREEADADADPRVSRKLREIATRFEVGQ
jgi:hypothetical protein